MEKTRYVVGFLFDNSGLQVALISKTHPEWQQSCLNGIGGKVEPGESPLDAMWRKGKEEAGVVVAWDIFYIGRYENCDVYYYRSFSDAGYGKARTMGDEEIQKWKAATITEGLDLVQGLEWLIPMALDKNEPGVKRLDDAK